MKIVIFLFLILLLGACSNDVTTIGQDLIDDESFVELVKYTIPTSTVKLDSFPTSTGAMPAIINELPIGHLKDPVTGTTIVTPYFEIVPSGGSQITNLYSYDSITFNFTHGGYIWGDTTQLQTFYLHQLKDLPYLDPETDLIYNDETVAYEEKPLGVIRFLPIKEKMKTLSFRIDDELGRKLYDMVRLNDILLNQDIDFIKFFKGLTLIADPSNTCILTMNAANDSLGLRLHFRDASREYNYNFNKSSNYGKYTFTNCFNNATGTPYALLTNQHEYLPFRDAASAGNRGQAVSQGLSGYLIKLQLPIAPASEKYRTIIKAEIELHPLEGSDRNYPRPTIINAYKSDKLNRILTTLTNAAGKEVTGHYVYNPQEPEKNKYIINITDYYNSLSQQANADEDNYIIVSLPLSEMSSSFNRLVIDELPILNVYYAKYE